MIEGSVETREPRIVRVSLLGAGAFGRVELGRLEEPFGALPRGLEVAIKRLAPELCDDPRAALAFEAEGRVGLEVRAPSLVKVLHRGRDAEGPYLVLEYVPGQSLRALLEAGPVPEPMLRGLARDVAAALPALHAAGVVHGDLKPENVKHDAQGRAIVLALGFARPMASGGAAGTNAGSLAYLSPDRALGAPPSAAADVFALGVMLYELACGAHPFLIAARARVSAGGGREWGSSDGKLLRRSIEVPGADEVLAAISTGRFAPPTRLAPTLSPFLEALIVDLLRRAPRR
jgi:serine/threonine protein kinase